MKIQFSPINFLKFQTVNKYSSIFLKYRYNLPFDAISFTGKSISQQVKELPKDAFLSEGLREYILANIDEKDLITLHKEYYAQLSECKTLDEAKELYPEFNSVIDMKDLDVDGLDSYTIRKISRGEIDGLGVDNASLEFLKRYVAKLQVILDDKENYFYISASTVKKLLGYFNISMDKRYFNVIVNQKKSQAKKSNWQNEDYRANMVALMNTSETRRRRSQKGILRYEDPEERLKSSERATLNWQNDEYVAKTIAAMQRKETREKHSRSIKEACKKPEAILRRKAAARANWQNESYKNIHEIVAIAKKLAAQKFRQSENNGAIDRIAKMRKIGEIQRQILEEWGFYDKDRNIDEILKLAQSFEVNN